MKMNKKLKDLTVGCLAVIQQKENDFESVVKVVSSPYTIKEQWFIKIEPALGAEPIKVRLEELKLLSKKEEKEWQDSLAIYHRNNPDGPTCCDGCCKCGKSH